MSRAARNGPRARMIRIVPQNDAVKSARTAGLRYVREGLGGFRRVARRGRYAYLNATGVPIRDERHLRRIRSLVIPPAWREVWICEDPDGHLQATGRDARGRKQYRYHPRWREVRDENKYGRMLAFARLLPRIRKRIARDLALPGLPREKILATVVRLLETTLIRIGNEEYARTNNSFGLTTMRDRHARVEGATVRFEFRGKSGVKHVVDLTDRRLARIVRQSQDLPGYELFQYVDAEGVRHAIDAADVNAYLRRIAGEDVTAKDFRTWVGSVLAAKALQECRAISSAAEAKRNVVAAIEMVAKRLGNTKTICRKCYVHPEIVQAYLEGSLARSLTVRIRRPFAREAGSLSPDEAAVVACLERRLGRKAGRGTGWRSTA